MLKESCVFHLNESTALLDRMPFHEDSLVEEPLFNDRRMCPEHDNIFDALQTVSLRDMKTAEGNCLAEFLEQTITGETP